MRAGGAFRYAKWICRASAAEISEKSDIIIDHKRVVIQQLCARLQNIWPHIYSGLSICAAHDIIRPMDKRTAESLNTGAGCSLEGGGLARRVGGPVYGRPERRGPIRAS